MSTTIKPRTASVPIYHGDDLQRLAELRREANAAEARAQRDLESAERLADGTPQRGGDADPLAEARAAFEAAVKPSRDAYDAFLDEAVERAVIVDVQAIGRRRFRDLMNAHPPRRVTVKQVEDDVEREVEQDHEDDAEWSVNTETFPIALLALVDGEKRTIAAPQMGAGQVRDFLDDEVSDGDFEKLWQTAYLLNRTPGADPKASRYSPASPRSDET